MENLENGVARIDPEVYKGLLAKLVGTYKYFNNNQPPDKVVIPFIDEVDGVPVEVEYPEETFTASSEITSDKAATEKAEEMIEEVTDAPGS